MDEKWVDFRKLSGMEQNWIKDGTQLHQSLTLIEQLVPGIPRLKRIRLKVHFSMLFTTTMVEVFSWVKTSMEVISTWSKVLRNVFAELILSSAAELLSKPKNHAFSAIFLKCQYSCCMLSRTKLFSPKIFVYVWRSKNVIRVLLKSQLIFVS